LQGVPLAIELAAGWVRQYSSTQIVQRIESSMDFLQSSFRNLPERHRSLRAVFDHSWELLTPPEQAVFCQLAIFEGGFSPEAADSVVSVQSSVFSEETTENWTLSTENWLMALADKSLLQHQPDGRYSLHPLLRQFAAEKQAEFTGAQHDNPQRHADYYLGFITRQGSGEEPEHRAALRTELANIRIAWQWAVKKHDFTALEQVIPILHNFYSIQSWFQEGLETFEFAANQLLATGHLETVAISPEYAAVLCDLLGRKARMHVHIGQLELARQALESTQSYLQKIDSPDLRSKILDTVAITYFYAGEYSQAEAVAEEILRYSEQSGSREGIAFAVNFLGSCAKAVGDYARASAFFERAVAVYRTLQDNLGAAMVLNNLGNLELARGNFRDARRYYHESSQSFKEADHTHGVATTLTNEGKLALREGDYEEARRLLTESLDLKQKMNDQRAMAIALSSLGDVSAQTGEITTAREQLAQALTLAHTSGDVGLVVEILVAVASLWINTGDLDRAARLLAFARHHPALTQEARERAEGLGGGLLQGEKVEQPLEKVIDRVLKTLESDQVSSSSNPTAIK
jgi:predicted ATPase/Tfp pilus assembly protein PilF